MQKSHGYIPRLTLMALFVVAALVSFPSASSSAPIKIGFLRSRVRFRCG